MARLEPARLGLAVKARPPWPGEFTGNVTQAESHGFAKVEAILVKGACGKKENGRTRN